MSRMGKRISALLLAVVMLVGLCAVPAGAEGTAEGGNWYDAVMTTWSDRGVLAGDAEGNLNPNADITRAELAVILDRIMGYQVKADNTFSDVADGQWYADAVLKASAAGVLKGDGSAARPGDSVTRQEVMVMLARVLGLSDGEAVTGFDDAALVSSWAQGAVSAMAAKGYVKGSEGKLYPTNNMTRAEVATLLDNVFKGYFDRAGSYDADVSGTALISAGDVTLSGLTVSGDLLIAEGVADGHVVLDGVTLTGKLIVRGGGENSIIIRGDSKIDQVVIARQEGKVRVSVEGAASVSAIYVDEGSDDVKVEGKVDTLTIAAPEVKVEITGTVKSVEVAESAAGAALTVAKEAEVETLTAAAPKAGVNVAGTVTKVEVAETAESAALSVEKGAKADTVAVAAPKTELSVAGTVSKVEVAATADNAAVSTEKGAKIASVTTNAAGTTVSGEKGTVTKIKAGKDATGTTANVSGAKVENKSAEPVKSGTGTIAAGKTGTAAGENEKPSTGSTGGGGGGSSGGGDSGPTLAEQQAAAKNALYTEVQAKLPEVNGSISSYAEMTLAADRAVTVSVRDASKDMAAVAGDVLSGVIGIVKNYNSGEIKSLTIADGEAIDMTAELSVIQVAVAGAVKAWGPLTASDTLADVLALDQNLVMTLSGTTAAGVTYTDTYTMKFAPGNNEAFAAALETVIDANLADINSAISTYATIASEAGTVTVTVKADQGDTPLSTVVSDILSPVVGYVKAYRAHVDGGIATLEIDNAGIDMNSATLDTEIIAAVKTWGGNEFTDHTLAGLVTLGKTLDMTLTDTNGHTAEYHMSFANAGT